VIEKCVTETFLIEICLIEKKVKWPIFFRSVIALSTYKAFTLRENRGAWRCRRGS
jgi:hypothetical protein